MEWSWDRLDPDERVVLSMLSAFNGGWLLDAAEGTCGELVTTPVAAVLRSLAAKSMIDPARTWQGIRYRMLESVRLFGQQQLDHMDLSEQAHRAHRDWYVNWVRTTPPDQRLFWQPWISRCVDELDNLTAAFTWSIERDDIPDAVSLHAALAGAMSWVVAPVNGYRWAQRLLECELDARDEVVVLMAGTMGALGIGDHAAMKSWGARAEERVEFADDCLAALILVWRAAVAVIQEPDRASRLLVAAREAAVRSGSRLVEGYVDAWQLHADLCTPEGRAIPRRWNAVDYGGAESVGWMTALLAATVHEARLGNLSEAMACRAAGETYFRGRVHVGRVFAHDTLAMALAADPASALDAARSAQRELDRTTDAVSQGEIVLAVAIAYARAGDAARALTYLEVLRDAPMILFIHYDLRRDFAHQVRCQLDDTAIADARTAATHLDVEAILDIELRPQPDPSRSSGTS